MRQIGEGSLEDGYGVAVSGYSGTEGFLYAPDAASDTVKVYDPGDLANFPESPSATITGPPGGFSSLRDSAVAVDDTSGDIYVLDDTQPAGAEQPRARVYAFGAAGEYLGHLPYDVVDGAPTGLAVDNSSLNPGRVYVSSGNTHFGGLYGYAPGATTSLAPLAPTIPPPPLGGGALFPTVPIGSAAPPPGGIACEGDACQTLPPEPVDPTLTTLLEGLGNPKPRYKRYRRHKKAHHRHHRHHHRPNRRKHRRARASTAPPPAAAASPTTGAAGAGSVTAGATGEGPAAQGLLPGAAGFQAAVHAADGTAATQAGSHPYSLELSFGLDQSSGEADLRELGVELPPGLLLNPGFSAALCSEAAFGAPRSSPYDPSGQSGESCPDRSQVGTVEVSAAGGATRRFGLFELGPAAGSAFRLGAAPFGRPLVLDAQIASDAKGAHLVLGASEIAQGLRATSLRLALWGAPWDASHNTERGDCLDEAEPGFAWCKGSVGEPLSSPPRAFLTLPTECRDSLAFSAVAGSWQQAGAESAAAVNRDPGGGVAPIGGCSSLAFSPDPEGFLSVRKASSSSGFVFRLSDEDPGLSDPRARIHAQAKTAVVELPDGVTLNPSLGAGLETCSPAQLAEESAFNPPGAGCPNAARIGALEVRSPFYEGLLKGGVYLAKPGENPYDTLLAVYLIAKSAERGVLISVPGKLIPDPGDGTLTATFDDLPQLPYTDLAVDFRSGQRAPLVSPYSCGEATTKITIAPWAQGAPVKTAASDSPIDAGIDFGPCPGGAAPPFSPGASAGGVNANVGSYTPYYVHLSRRDTEQEITSYSLLLPEGITGKLAGIPFCADSAIAAARRNSGFAEAAGASCPAASEVGHTLTGYGVGPALTYAEGQIYLAGPYHGAPLSLVTINPATVGPFDLGTIVVRSAFDVDPLSAQLSIDSRASDPIPHIVDGIPLHLRDVRVYIDRPEFTHNPSSCEPSSLLSTLTGAGASFEDPADDSTATIDGHFQLLNCLTLGFHPKLGLRLRGPARRGGFPALRASFASRGPRDSNLKRIEVDMPQPAVPGPEPHPQGLHQGAVRRRLLPGRLRLRQGRRLHPASRRTAAWRGLPAKLRQQAARPGHLASLGGDPDRPGRPHRPLEEGRYPGLLRQPARRADRPLRDDPARRAPRAAHELGRRLPPSPPRHRQGAGPERHRRDLHQRAARPLPEPKEPAVSRLAAAAALCGALAALCALAAALSASAEVAQKGNLRVKVTAAFTPTRLPRSGAAPIAVSVAGSFATADGSLPPQLKQMRIELNSHGYLQTAGLPECRVAQIQPASTARALRACREALVGRGSFSVDVVLGNQQPYPTSGRLLVFNGRYRGRPALLGQIYSSHPFANSFVIPFEISHHRGRYGNVLSATLPRAFTSWGHVTALRLRLGRRYTYRGRRRSLLSAGCPAPAGFPGALFSLARTSFRFAGATRIETVLTRGCKVRR